MLLHTKTTSLRCVSILSFDTAAKDKLYSLSIEVKKEEVINNKITFICCVDIVSIAYIV